jgi:hypothetical protein
MMLQLILLFLNFSFAQDFSKFEFLTSPEIYTTKIRSQEQINISPICAEMKYNYAEEKAKLDALKLVLNKLTQMPLTDDVVSDIEKTKNEMHDCLGHLTFLSKPEWNTQVVDLYVVWYLTNYDHKEHAVKNKEVLSAYYKGERNGKIIEYLDLNLRIYDIFPHKVPFFLYSSRTTYLDACQNTASLEFEVKSDVTCYFSPIPCNQAYFILKGQNP